MWVVETRLESVRTSFLKARDCNALLGTLEWIYLVDSLYLSAVVPAGTKADAPGNKAVIEDIADEETSQSAAA